MFKKLAEWLGGIISGIWDALAGFLARNRLTARPESCTVAALSVCVTPLESSEAAPTATNKRGGVR